MLDESRRALERRHRGAGGQVVRDRIGERDLVLIDHIGEQGPGHRLGHRADLERAELFVQLLGPFRSNRPADLKDEIRDNHSKKPTRFRPDYAYDRDGLR